jgi:hypothetical protein
MSDGSDVSAAQLAAGNAQTYQNNAQQYATQASSSAAIASGAANQAAQAAQSATQNAAVLLALVSGAGTAITQLRDTDALGVVRTGQLYSVSYSTLKASLQDGLLQASNNLDDVEDAQTALTNLGGVARNSIKSSLVTNSSTDTTVSTTFSFTPGQDGVLSVLAQGGSNGSTEPAVELVIATTVTTGCALENDQCNGNGSYQLACYSAQYTVTAGVPVTVTVTQTGPAGTSSNTLASLFIYLPG